MLLEAAAWEAGLVVAARPLDKGQMRLVHVAAGLDRRAIALTLAAQQSLQTNLRWDAQEDHEVKAGDEHLPPGDQRP